MHYQGLLFLPKAIWTKLISHQHNNLLTNHFGIEKTSKLLPQKYYKPIFCYDI